MRANQTMVASDGYEVCLFPFEYMYMSQDEGGDYSHAGTYNLDFLGWGANGRILQCPFYAPCSLECVAIWDNTSNNRVYQSTNKVHFADGSLDYLTICFAHDDNPIYNIGDTINQGDILGHTGTFGQVTGDHTHTCCGIGQYGGYTERASGKWDLTNRCHYWDATYVNNTTIVEGYGHNWRTYGADTSKKDKFNFLLFSKVLKDARKVKKVNN